MILSHHKRFVMLLPWKTGSQTAVTRLSDYDESPYSKFFQFNPHLNRVVHQHMTLADFSALPESRLGYFTASFVRNPYDRVCSGFEQLQYDLRAQPDARFESPWVRDLVLAQLEENRQQMQRSGHDIDVWFSLVRDEQVLEAGRNTNFPLHPAHYWTHRNGKQAVSFVGRVENFEVDFARFLRRVGIDSVPAINANVRNLVGTANCRTGYRYPGRLSKRTISRINALFADDFEMFDYPQLHT
jgi:hypothetical protein